MPLSWEWFFIQKWIPGITTVCLEGKYYWKYLVNNTNNYYSWICFDGALLESPMKPGNIGCF